MRKSDCLYTPALKRGVIIRMECRGTEVFVFRHPLTFYFKSNDQAKPLLSLSNVAGVGLSFQPTRESELYSFLLMRQFSFSASVLCAFMYMTI